MLLPKHPSIIFFTLKQGELNILFKYIYILAYLTYLVVYTIFYFKKKHPIITVSAHLSASHLSLSMLSSFLFIIPQEEGKDSPGLMTNPLPPL